jgi:hypothetical protein
MRYPERNQSPILTTLAIVGAAVAIEAAVGTLVRADPRLLGALAADLVMAGIALAAWASQTSSRWSRQGYLWRFGLVCLVVVSFGMFCVKPRPF